MPFGAPPHRRGWGTISGQPGRVSRRKCFIRIALLRRWPSAFHIILTAYLSSMMGLNLVQVVGWACVNNQPTRRKLLLYQFGDANKKFLLSSLVGRITTMKYVKNKCGKCAYWTDHRRPTTIITIVEIIITIIVTIIMITTITTTKTTTIIRRIKMWNCARVVAF